MARKNILVVEDEEDILELVKFHLTREGFIVTSATNGEDAIVNFFRRMGVYSFIVTSETNGEDALKAIYRNQPDLLLLDLMLP